MTPQEFSTLNLGEVSPVIPVRHTRDVFTRRLADLRFFLRLFLYAHVTIRLFSPSNIRKLVWTKLFLWPKHGRKFMLPYLSQHYSRGMRLKILLDHYAIVRELGLFQFSKGLKDHCVILSRFLAKSGTAQYNIVLAPSPEAYQEGELILCLTNDSEVIYSVGFSFLYNNGKKYIQVGCIQGGKSAKSTISTATRELFSCCPRFFLMALIRGIGAHLGCEGVILVGNKNRISSLKAEDRLFLDYDRIWQDIDAVDFANGDFFVTCENIVKTDFSDVASKRRSEARKKAALIGVTIQSVNSGLALLNDARARDLSSAETETETETETGTESTVRPYARWYPLA